MPGQRNGVFTRHLLDGLRGAAEGADGVIRIFDLYHYVQQRVVADIGAQRPVFKSELEDNYPIALYRGGAAPTAPLPPAPDALTYDASSATTAATRPTAHGWSRSSRLDWRLAAFASASSTATSGSVDRASARWSAR